MIRAIIGFALVAVASANIAGDAHETAQTNTENEKTLALNMATLNGLKTKISLAEQSFASTKASVERVDALAADVMGMDGTVQDMVAQANNNAAQDQEDAAKQLDDEKKAIMKSLMDAAKAARQSMADAKENTHDAFKSRTDAVVTKFNAIKEAVAGDKTYLANVEKCANQGKTLNKNGDCVVAAISDSSGMSTINYRTWKDQNDGRDHGYLNGRHINFEKKDDKTALKIIYYDNMRVHGHTAHAMWEVQFCDAGGGGCSNCNKPGRIMHWRWSGHQHNWWINDHFGGELYGLCTAADNKELKAGKYQIKIRLHHNRYDIHTGHGGQHGSIQVEEVMLA